MGDGLRSRPLPRNRRRVAEVTRIIADRNGATPRSTLGPYEILSLIGDGGMGEVYLARDTRLDRKVAVEVLAPGPTGDRWRLSQNCHATCR